MKQEPEVVRNRLLKEQRNGLGRSELFNSNSCAVKTVLENLDADASGEKSVWRMVKPEALTVVKESSAAAQPDSLTDQILCDDILSCISALDEVIAEFDDSISYSSSSSVASESGASLQKLQGLANTQPLQSSAHREQQQTNLITSVLVPALEQTNKVMQEEATAQARFQLDNSQGQRSSPQRGQGQEQRPQSNVAPVKPARQSKKVNGCRPTSTQSPPFQIEQHTTGTSGNGNHLSYGIVFPKATSQSPSQQTIFNNNNVTSSSISPASSPSSRILNSSSGSSLPRAKPNKSVDACRATAKSSASSPQKPIPVTFVMKPEDLERFLEVDREEDWNCHIEKNLPRSLRKTRKTCFVEDDEEEQQKYCRSPKDFRKNLVGGNGSPKRSPLLNQRKSSIPQDPGPDSRVLPAQWMRYEDASAIGFQESNQTPPRPQLPPQVNNASNNNSSQDSPTYRNLNELFTRKGRQPTQPGTSPVLTTHQPPPATLDQVLDIDDGYLSMINRHEAPLLWPEGAIETETFTADELKRLSVSNLNYLNVGARGSKEQDYFSDDSLELDGEGEMSPIPKKIGHQHHPHLQSDKMSSFISASASSPPVVVQPYINKSSTRKSWSPASEIRIPAKSTINTNTWRKGVFAPPVISLDEDAAEERFVFKKAASPVRKPCAFFIPIHNMEDKGDKSKPTNEVTNIASDTRKSLDSASEPTATASLDSLADQLSSKVVESGMREAACINALLASPPTAVMEMNGNHLEGLLEAPGGSTAELVSLDLNSLPRQAEASPLNSSLGLSQEERLGSSGSEARELESTSSSSGIDYETSSEGRERNLDSIGAVCGSDSYYKDDSQGTTVPGFQGESSPPPLRKSLRPTADDIEDLYENPPSFIPPPPQVTSSPVTVKVSPARPVSTLEPRQQRHSAARSSGGSESEKDYFPDTFPKREIAGERPLRTERQTSRSHENLLDIDRVESGPHPCVRRGHSATLPSNAVAPLTTRRPSALRQFFGIFRRNKKHSNASDALDHSYNHRELGGSLSLGDDCPQLPEHYSPYMSNRPSVSDSQGSQRSNTSKTSTKRSVLSRIFRRKEK